MRRRLIAALAAVAIGTVGALVFASPSTASMTRCSFPEDEVKAVVQDQPATKAALESEVADFAPQLAKCLEVVFTDKCDGTTIPSATNWATNDNQWTVIKLKINGITKELEGGSSPNTETWPAIGPPGNESIQPWLVFDFELQDGTNIHIEKPYGEPWTWEEPKGCVSPSPSVSTTAPVTSAPATTSSPAVPPVSRGDVSGPVTGASTTMLIVAGVVLLVSAGLVVILRRRRSSESVA